jgi:outer membrane biogenesis lipoprotein LolB
MRGIAICVVTLLLAACSSMPQRQEAAASACEQNEASYACQVERYSNVNAD